MSEATAAQYTARIIGYIWWPNNVLCSTVVEYTGYDGDEAAIEDAMTTQAGDFSRVVDVQVTRYRGPHGRLAETVKDWDSEDNESAYWNTRSDLDD